MVADRRLAGEHAGVGAVEDRVGHVGRLGAGGPPRMLHAVEHLRGHDHRLLIPLAGADDLLLHHGNRGDVDLHAEVAAGHHHDVGGLDDRVEVVDRLALLDLGDDAGPGATGPQQLLEQLDLDRRADERQADEVGPRPGRPFGVPPVIGAHRRDRELDPGQVHPLPAADHAPLDDAAAGPVGKPLLDDEAHGAVGEHHRVAHGELVDQRRVGDGERPRSGHRAADERHLLPLDAVHVSAGKLAEPDLRPGEIDEHADVPAGGGRHAPHPVERLLVLGRRAVGHVEAEHVDARGEQRADRLLRVGGGADRGDDLRAHDRGRGRGRHGGHSLGVRVVVWWPVRLRTL